MGFCERRAKSQRIARQLSLFPELPRSIVLQACGAAANGPRAHPGRRLLSVLGVGYAGYAQRICA
jgi:hypothetical protein